MNTNTIKKRIAHIEECKKEIKEAKQIITDQLENNAEYMDAKSKAKEAQGTKKRIKDEILAKPENEKFLFEIKENEEEISTETEILSAELVEFYQKNNSDEIEDDSGKKRKFKFSVKLFPARDE